MKISVGMVGGGGCLTISKTEIMPACPVVLWPFHQASSAQLSHTHFQGPRPNPHGAELGSSTQHTLRPNDPSSAQSTPATGIVRRASCGRRPGRPSRRTESQLREASLITHTRTIQPFPPAPQDCKSLDRSGRVWLRNRLAVREGLPKTDGRNQCAAWGPQCEAAGHDCSCLPCPALPKHMAGRGIDSGNWTGRLAPRPIPFPPTRLAECHL